MQTGSRAPCASRSASKPPAPLSIARYSIRSPLQRAVRHRSLV